MNRSTVYLDSWQLLLGMSQNLGDDGGLFPDHAFCPSLHPRSWVFSVDSWLPVGNGYCSVRKQLSLGHRLLKRILDTLVVSRLQYWLCYLWSVNVSNIGHLYIEYFGKLIEKPVALIPFTSKCCYIYVCHFLSFNRAEPTCITLDPV